MRWSVEDPAVADVTALLNEHLEDMYATSPPESVHALDIAALQAPEITFVTARDADGSLMGCGAIKAHADGTHEIKSMRTVHAYRGQGVARGLVVELLRQAAAQGSTLVRLETGVEDYFAPARSLYEAVGFTRTGPFADYTHDPLSVYYERSLPATR